MNIADIKTWYTRVEIHKYSSLNCRSANHTQLSQVYTTPYLQNFFQLRALNDTMSPRTNSYLSLCLEQVSLSSLHYRHRCVIVPGGNVIGQGYNDHKPRFNGGGILKTGRFGASASASSAIVALKQKTIKVLVNERPKIVGNACKRCRDLEVEE